jgi:hypothetical protein
MSCRPSFFVLCRVVVYIKAILRDAFVLRRYGHISVKVGNEWM